MKKSVLVLVFVAALAAPARVLAGPDEDLQVALQLLTSKAAPLGSPSIKGEEAVAGKMAPALHFGERQRDA